jgi:16S rRNA (cytosine967-C5)-methyltransferase
VLRRGEPLDQAAPPLLRPVPRADDRALAMAIAQEVLRWLVDLDALIDNAMRLPLPPDAKARSVLRMMLVQVLRLGLPPHAVIATGLPLLAGGPRRLAHGVFSAVLTKGEAALPITPGLPEPVALRWEAAWPERIDAIRAGLAEPPPLDLTLADPALTAHWVQTLGGISLMPGHVRLPRGSAVESLPGFAEGAWWVQDLAAAIPARMIGAPPHPGARALDLCAAPGGKTLQLAAAGWTVTAIDKSPRRLERLSENLTRTQQSAEVIAADALTWQPDHGFDAILIDAQFQRNDAEQLVQQIKQSGKKLSTVYVSHSDPDYYFGLDVIQAAFPNAKIVATPQTVAAIKSNMEGKKSVLESDS